jgi:threonine dehydrogenase-like Zn-dependent dehydrogenase
MRSLVTTIVALALAGSPAPARHVAPAEVVMVRGLGPVGLAAFECRSIARSVAVTRVCRDPDGRRAVAEIGGRHLAYCNLPDGLVDAWLAAPSMGRYHAAHLAGRHACG